jgi:hypothetical protein
LLGHDQALSTLGIAFVTKQHMARFSLTAQQAISVWSSQYQWRRG